MDSTTMIRHSESSECESVLSLGRSDDVTLGDLEVNMTVSFDGLVGSTAVVLGELEKFLVSMLGLAFCVMFMVTNTVVLGELGVTVLLGRMLGELLIKEEFDEAISGFLRRKHLPGNILEALAKQLVATTVKFSPQVTFKHEKLLGPS